MAHILFVVSWYKTPEEPMSGSFFEEFARGMMKQGHQTGILFPHHIMQFKAPWDRPKSPESFNDKGIPTFYSFSKSIVPGIRKINFSHFYRRVNLAFRSYVNQHGMPDLLHAQAAVWGGLAANWLSHQYQIPFVLTEHSTNLKFRKCFQHPLYKMAITSAFHDSQGLAAVSQSLKNQLVDQYQLAEARIKVIPNLLPGAFFDHPTTTSFQNPPFRICAIGYLIARKRFSLSIDTISSLRSQGHPVELTIIGDGPLRKKLEQQADTLGLRKFIHFTGLLNREEVRKTIDQSHCLLSTSEYETFGVNLIEALARGRPVVSTDSFGPRDIIRPGKDGLLCEEDDVETLTSAITTLIQNYDQYDQEEIHQSCRERFSESAILGRYESMYAEIMQTASGRANTHAPS